MFILPAAVSANCYGRKCLTKGVKGSLFEISHFYSLRSHKTQISRTPITLPHECILTTQSYAEMLNTNAYICVYWFLYNKLGAKSHNTPVPYSTMHYFVTGIFVAKWCIVRYMCDALEFTGGLFCLIRRNIFMIDPRDFVCKQFPLRIDYVIFDIYLVSLCYAPKYKMAGFTIVGNDGHILHKYLNTTICR